MITFHSQQSDSAQRARKNEDAGIINFTSQIASSICTVIRTKHVKRDATNFTSRCSRTVLCYRLDRVQTLPLSLVRFLRLANGSSKNRRSPARSPTRCLAHSRTFAAQLPGCGKCDAAECPHVNSQDNSQVGAKRSRKVRVAVHAKADATSREISRKMTALNSVITISNLTPKNYELIAINTQP
jgi:hypothetical protein